MDKDGNVVNQKGHVKILKELLSEKGEIPSLYSYEGAKFAIKDVIGDLDREKMGEENVLKFDKQTAPNPENP